MKETKELTCISCPLGCSLQSDMDGGEVLEVRGNSCKRGDIYARKELTNPTRILTSSVWVEGGDVPLVSVKTKSDIPKGKIFDAMKALKGLKVQAPVHIGDVVLANVADTGVDIVATRNSDSNR